MKQSLKTALAYAHICGFLPKHIHLDTWSKAQEYLVPNTYPRTVKPEYLDQIADHPFMIGHARLTAEGYRPTQKHGRTSHTIEYRHPDHEDQAFIIRSGGGWYWRKIPGAGFKTEEWT
jgi:hypothetical protein